MDVRITLRHGTAGAGFLQTAEEKARGLTKFEPRLRQVEILFDGEGRRAEVEARAVVPGVPARVARAAGETRRRALDQVLRKVKRQLRRDRSKRIDHRASPLTGIAE